MFDSISNITNEENIIYNLLSDEKQNLMIEGDNLEAIDKLKKYKAKVDVVYIDPPYNTKKNDLPYNDEFELDEWKSIIADSVKASKEIIKDTGFILLSINQKMYHLLRQICDELYGSKNILGIIKIKMQPQKGLGVSKCYFQNTFEYLLIYAKNVKEVKINKNKTVRSKEEYLAKHKYSYYIEVKEFIEEIEKGNKKIEIYTKDNYSISKNLDTDYMCLKKVSITGRSKKESNNSGKFYEKYLKELKDTYGPSPLFKVYGLGRDGIGYRYFTISNESKENNGIYYQGVPLEYLDENGKIKDEIEIKTAWNDYLDMEKYNEDNNKLVQSICGKKFTSSKPLELMDFILELVDKNSKILDMFSGSASLEHSIIKKNYEEKTNISFIACQNNENKIFEEFTIKRVDYMIKHLNSDIKVSYIKI